MDCVEQLKSWDERFDELERLAGQQAYPRSKIKVGAVLYKVDVSEYDDGSMSVAVDEWIVRSIKRKRGSQTIFNSRRPNADVAPVYVNVTAKIKDVTWIRLSRKVNDFGWSKSISQYHRAQFKVGRRLPKGLFTTPLAALKYALKSADKNLQTSLEYLEKAQDVEEYNEVTEWIESDKKALRLIKSRIKKLTKK